MSTRIFVQKDGVVIHSHPGVNGLHGPWTSHKEPFHTAENADVPENLSELTDAQKAQYKEALAGKNFSYMWVTGTAERKAKVEENGGTWRYGKAMAVTPPTPPTAEELKTQAAEMLAKAEELELAELAAAELAAAAESQEPVPESQPEVPESQEPVPEPAPEPVPAGRQRRK